MMDQQNLGTTRPASADPAAIALALFLRIGSALLIRGVYLLDHQPLGFNRDHILTAGLVLDKERYSDATRQAQFVRDLVHLLNQLPAAQGAAITSDLPASGAESVPIHINGRPEPRTGEPRTHVGGPLRSPHPLRVEIPEALLRPQDREDDRD